MTSIDLKGLVDEQCGIPIDKVDVSLSNEGHLTVTMVEKGGNPHKLKRQATMDTIYAEVLLSLCKQKGKNACVFSPLTPITEVITTYTMKHVVPKDYVSTPDTIKLYSVQDNGGGICGVYSTFIRAMMSVHKSCQPRHICQWILDDPSDQDFEQLPKQGQRVYTIGETVECLSVKSSGKLSLEHQLIPTEPFVLSCQDQDQVGYPKTVYTIYDEGLTGEPYGLFSTYEKAQERMSQISSDDDDDEVDLEIVSFEVNFNSVDV